MLPYVVILAVLWTLFFVAWYLFGIPLGPGRPVKLSTAPAQLESRRSRRQSGIGPIRVDGRAVSTGLHRSSAAALLLPQRVRRPRRRDGARRALRAGRAARRSRRRSAATGSRTRRSTSTCSSTSRRSRCAARGAPDLVKIAPAAGDLSAERFEYHLDFPGNALQPGCDYERWAQRVTEGTAPTVYAHVATEPRPARASSRSSTGSTTSSTTGTTRTRATGR